MFQQGILQCDASDNANFRNMVALAKSHVLSVQPTLLAPVGLRFALPTSDEKSCTFFSISETLCTFHCLCSGVQRTKGTERDMRKLPNSNPAGKWLPLVFAVTGREGSDPSVIGHKAMNGEWKLHSFQDKIRPLDNFVSPLIHLKL